MQSLPSFGEFEKARSKSFKDDSAKKATNGLDIRNSNSETRVAPPNQFLKELNERSTRTQQLLNRVNNPASEYHSNASRNLESYQKESTRKFEFRDDYTHS